MYGSSPAGEAALGARAVTNGADCLVIDAEAEYEGRYASAQTYITDLRATVGPDYPIGLAGFPYVDFHPAFPYSVFLGPGGAQFNAPQMYWKDIGTTVDTVFAHTYTNNTIYQRPIYPLGQTFQSPPSSQIIRFRQLADAYGATGVSWWDWQETPSALWASLGSATAGADRLHAHHRDARAEGGRQGRRDRVAPGAPQDRRPGAEGRRPVRVEHDDRGQGVPDGPGPAVDRRDGRPDLERGARRRADDADLEQQVGHRRARAALGDDPGRADEIGVSGG